MKLRQGIVVATHPEDHSVDLVMLDDGSRMVGVQVLTPNGSQRTGTFNMAPVTRDGDKWDITRRGDQDQYAVVGFIGNNPVVVGYLFPQINQMALKSDKTFYFRHHSDLEIRVNERGALHISHPGGLNINVGTTAGGEAEPAPHADNAARDRNNGTLPNFSLTIAGQGGGAFSLAIGPDGQVVLSTKKGVNVTAAEDIKFTSQAGIEFVSQNDFKITAPKVRAETPSLSVSGDVNTDAGVSHNTHVHGGVMPGGADTSGPH